MTIRRSTNSKGQPCFSDDFETDFSDISEDFRHDVSAIDNQTPYKNHSDKLRKKGSGGN